MSRVTNMKRKANNVWQTFLFVGLLVEAMVGKPPGDVRLDPRYEQAEGLYDEGLSLDSLGTAESKVQAIAKPKSAAELYRAVGCKKREPWR